jgi:hypothetical protein
LLGHSVGGARIKGCRLGLRNFLDFPIKLGSGRLVKFDLFLDTTGTDGIEHTEYTDSITVCSIFWHIEGYLYVTHGSKIVNFSGSYIGDYGDKISRITKVSVV